MFACRLVIKYREKKYREHTICYRKEESRIFHKLKERFFKLLSFKDNPYILAKSMSLGFGLALLPLPGLNLPLGIILAKLLRLNIAATSVPALLLTYASPFLYVLNYKTGAFFIKTSEKPPQEFAYDLTFVQKVIDFFVHAGPAYLLGSVINATLAAAVSYFVFLFIYKNTSRFLQGKKIKLTRIKNLPGFRAGVCKAKNFQVLSRIKQKKRNKKKKEEKKPHCPSV